MTTEASGIAAPVESVTSPLNEVLALWPKPACERHKIRRQREYRRSRMWPRRKCEYTSAAHANRRSLDRAYIFYQAAALKSSSEVAWREPNMSEVLHSGNKKRLP